jgi:lipopolysaccharide transport system permease protein
MVEVVRAPLLGVEPPLSTWAVLIAMLAVGGGATFALFGRFRGRVAYWL